MKQLPRIECGHAESSSTPNPIYAENLTARGRSTRFMKIPRSDDEVRSIFEYAQLEALKVVKVLNEEKTSVTSML